MVMISIVVGLGITHLMGDVGSLVKDSSLTKIYIPNLVRPVVIFLLLVHFWWAMLPYRVVDERKWTYISL